MLARIIDSNALIVPNRSNKCQGLITRRRITKDRIEESCIDVLMFRSDLQESFNSMVIDDQRKHVLSKIRKNKKGILVKETDHHVLLAKFSNIAKSRTKTRN